ncbi:MAG: DUF3566 domain-containing protein [candidate division Zixibacteria bacterium]|nr:DUF3566 domain-containing protein [candidate division Zixibacteria bacterium]
MKFELRSIGYWAIIKISFTLNLVMGFLIGIFYAFFLMLMAPFMTELQGFGDMPMFEDGIGFLLILIPIAFSLLGAVFNTILLLIAAFIYNVVARLVGGLEFELRQCDVPPPQTYQAAPAHQYAAPPPPPPPPPVGPLPPDVQPPEEGTDSGRPQV